MDSTLSTSGNAPSSPRRYNLTQTLLLCHPRLPAEETVLLLVGHLRIPLPVAAWPTCGQWSMGDMYVVPGVKLLVLTF